MQTDNQPQLQEPDRFVFRGQPFTTEQLLEPAAADFVRELVRPLLKDRVRIRTEVRTPADLIDAAVVLFRSCARRGSDTPAMILWAKDVGGPAYAVEPPELTRGLFGGGPNQVLMPPGEFLEFSARVLTAHERPAFVGVCHEGWGVRRDVPKARAEEIERERAAGRIRLGNLPAHERGENFAAYAQAATGEDALRLWVIEPDARGRRALVDLAGEAAELHVRFAPLQPGTTSKYAIPPREEAEPGRTGKPS
jgi:hypothetical protein